MFHEKKEKYDPVTAPIPGVDQNLRQEELTAFQKAGDPLPIVQTGTKRKVIFSSKILGITITK